jgi:hypothetical protein
VPEKTVARLEGIEPPTHGLEGPQKLFLEALDAWPLPSDVDRVGRRHAEPNQAVPHVSPVFLDREDQDRPPWQVSYPRNSLPCATATASA